MQQYDEIQEHRLQQMEKMVNVLVEGQSTMAQILQEQVKRMDRLETRMDRLETRMEKVEELLTLALDDLAYIKEILRRDG